MLKRIALFFCLSFPLLLVAQEIIIDIENIKLQNYSKFYHENVSIKSTNIDTLELPFFDDFSNSYIYPDSTKWLDKFAYIGYNYAIDPISIGNATLDALNQFGFIYPGLPYNITSLADHLTSLPIDLDYPAEDSLYLSFFYQAGGYGNTPEYGDSLVLEFKAPDTEWESVWRMHGGENMDYFEQVMIGISDEKWLKKGFQFRFKNYVSLSSPYELSWVGNADLWHLDFIKLDINRAYDDTISNDVAFIQNSTSFIEGYESVPWNHFKSDDYSHLLKDSISFVYKNTWNEVQNINRQFELYNARTGDTLVSVIDDSENIQAYETIFYNKQTEFSFASSEEDSASFLFKLFIQTDLLPERRMYRWNDTIRYYQNFYNYYAYDDGSAEKGYGIAGQGTAYSSVALRVTPLMSDTLRGIYMFFNHTLNEANQKFFFLNVWDDSDGVPGDTLYQQVGARPEYSGIINGFVYYPLETPLYIEDTFYIGWTKTTDDILNIGFDINRNSSENLLFNVTGEWQNSSAIGAIMIRPVFGAEPYPLNVVDYHYNTVSKEYDIFPIPAVDVLNVLSTEDADILEIYDARGSIKIRQAYQNQINVESLSAGIYFIRLLSDNHVFESKRFVIVK